MTKRYTREDLSGSASAGCLFRPATSSLSSLKTPPWEPRPEMAAYHWQRTSVAQHVHSLAYRLSQQQRGSGLAPLAWSPPQVKASPNPSALAAATSPNPDRK